MEWETKSFLLLPPERMPFGIEPVSKNEKHFNVTSRSRYIMCFHLTTILLLLEVVASESILPSYISHNNIHLQVPLLLSSIHVRLRLV